jgi:adenylate cyclase
MAGHTIGQFTGDVPTAMRAIDRALTLNANAAYAWATKGWLNLYLDRSQDAIDALNRGRRLSPLDPMGYFFTMGLARAYLAAGQYEEAVPWADAAIAEAPRLSIALRMKVVLSELIGLHDEAREWLDRMREVAPNMTIENFSAYSARHYTPALRKLFVETLRKVGLPE